MWNILGLLTLLLKLFPALQYNRFVQEIYGSFGIIPGAALITGTFSRYLIIPIIIEILAFIGLLGIFRKAGRPLWYAFIPILNIYTFYKIISARWILVGNIIIAFAISFVTIRPIHALCIVLLFILELFEYGLTASAFRRGFAVTLCLVFFYPLTLLYIGWAPNVKYGFYKPNQSQSDKQQ